MTSAARVVLVTGVADPYVCDLARHLAAHGAAAGVEKVVGVDATLPTGDLGDVKFLRTDVRTPVIGKILAVESVDTMVHLGLKPSGSGSVGKELNVIGSMQVLAASQRNPSVKKFVLGSSTAVYGGSAKDPALWVESGSAREGARSGFAKDVVDAEGYTRGFARRRRDVTSTTLRFAQVLSPRSQSPLAEYFRLPALPTVGGYDPRLQFLHPDDAAEVLLRAVVEDHPGVYNVAGPGVITLAQAARQMGRPTIPVLPLASGVTLRRMVSLLGAPIAPDLGRLLTYGRVVDIGALEREFGFTPQHSTAETFAEFAVAQRPGLLHLGRVAR